MRTETAMPKSRVDQLVIQEMPDETLVYDLERHKAHCLNKTATAVWRRCDGRTSIGEMARLLHDETGLPADESIVWMAINQLGKARLLDGNAKPPTTSASRRDALKRIGLVGGAAALLPVITSIVAPTSVSAITCIPSGGSCLTSSQCCTGLCNVDKCA